MTDFSDDGIGDMRRLKAIHDERQADMVAEEEEEWDDEEEE